MKRFQNRTIHKEIDEAIKDAERLLDWGSPMMKDIYNKSDFEFSSGDGAAVAATFEVSEVVVNIFTYRPFNPWTSAIGHFDGKDIHVNVRKLPYMSHVDLVGLLLHEYGHACGFTHGNNYKTEYKGKHSVSYFMSENAGRWLEEMKTVPPVTTTSSGVPISSAPAALFI